jgi:FlaA1/EpsC-like NDP-sugar epimerase
MNIKKNIIEIVLDLPRFVKQIVALICDSCLCLICVVVAFYLRIDEFVALKGPVLTAAWSSVCLALPIFWFTGLYRMIFRYSGYSIIFSASIGFLVYGLLYFSIFGLFKIQGIPRSIGILQPLLLFFGFICSRLFVKFILKKTDQNKFKSFKNTLVYGTGSQGRQLASSLENSLEFKIVGFLDDEKKIKGQLLQGLIIYNPDNLEALIQAKNIEVVLLALPSIGRFNRNKILEKLRKYKLIVQTLPSVSDIIEGKITISDIKELDILDILDREPVPPKKKLLFKNIKDKIVLVTGAGGSIGSEICRQVIKICPKALILCELNEFAIYKIYEELNIFSKKIKIIPLLANVQNEKKMNEILKTFKVDTVYHAAAYKHVPLVESNICEGIQNNVFGTFSIVKACIKQNVSNFVLISSDKAVRPTNIMGATKRLSELCVQALYQKYSSKNINMSIVRFGNVLESSGSVIPKFKQQIKQGGPVTLTHPEVTRYFMTTTEAAQLVIQAGAMSKGCEVFLLNMGRSIKIKDLINRIIQLSGLSIRDEQHPDGDIEIKIIGLRPGEKLFEELLIGNNSRKTGHPEIKKASDPFIPFDQFKIDLENLSNLINNNKIGEIKNLFDKLLNINISKTPIVDYIANKNNKKINLIS